jgi:hypothetical protein
MKSTINLLTPFPLFRTSREYATLNMGISDQFRVSLFENEFTEDGAAGAEASANLVSIDDPMATYGQKNVPVSLTLKEAPILTPGRRSCMLHSLL